jgi:hypothetical protein
MPTIPASFDEEASVLDDIDVSGGEGVLVLYRAGVIVSSDDMDGVAPWEALLCIPLLASGAAAVRIVSGARKVIVGRMAVTIVVLDLYQLPHIRTV